MTPCNFLFAFNKVDLKHLKFVNKSGGIFADPRRSNYESCTFFNRKCFKKLICNCFVYRFTFTFQCQCDSKPIFI